MNSIQNNANERGSAILMVLGLLSLLLVMALIFAVTSRNAQIVADANADQTQAKLVSRSGSTRATDALFFFQNKGNLLGNPDLEASMPLSDDDNVPGEMLDQTPHRNGTGLDLEDPYADTYYGIRGTKDDDDPILGLQPYVGYVDATGKWKDLALYGEFNHEGFAETPFGLATGEPYQSIYYSHEDDSYDEVKNSKEHSLFNIVYKKTRLGMAYGVASSADYRADAASASNDGEAWGAIQTAEDAIKNDASDDQFKKLLNDKDNLSRQLQFREEKDSDGHVTQRLGFIAFADGSKFDLNQITASKMTGDAGEPYVPFVDDDMRPAAGGDPGTGGTAHLATSTAAATVPSAYAIMGYDYDAKHLPESIINKLVEEETVQYGLHPQELRTREKKTGGKYKAVYVKEEVLKRKDGDVPPKWFSHDQLLPPSESSASVSQELKDVKSNFLKDIYILSLASGAEEREYRFTGRYASLEQMDGFAASDMQNGSAKYFVRKIDLAWPKADYAADGEFLGAETPSWNKISSLVETRGGLSYDEFFERFCRECLGLDYDSGDSGRYLFKGSGGEDLTQEVLANMIDACDTDNNVTYRWDLNFGSTLGADDTINEPSFCGNEMDVPAIMGVCVSVGMDDARDFVNSTVSRGRFRTENGGGGFPGGGFFQYEQIPIFSFNVDLNYSAMTAYYNPKVNLNLQNLLDADQLSSHKKFRVILKGKVVSALKVKKVSMQYVNTGMGGGRPGSQNGQWMATVTNGLTGFSRTQDFVECPGTTRETLNAENETAYLAWLAGTSEDYGVKPGDENAAVIQELLQDAEEFTFDKEFTRSLDPLDALECDEIVELDMGNFSFDSRKLPDGNSILSSLRIYDTRDTPVFYYPTGGVVAVRLDQIVVMAQDEAGDSKMSDIVYAAAPSETWSVAEGGLETQGFQQLIAKRFDDFFDMRPVNGVLCRDPRLNHKSKAWKWLSDYDDAGSTVLHDLVEASGAKVRRLPHAVTALGAYNFTVAKADFDDWCDDEFVSKGCWALMEETLANADSTVAKDWEPGFAPTTGSVADHKMGAALSTAVRLNAPFTSLWQVGSIFRGEIGQTLNLKKFGTDDTGVITHLYEDGDAWLLDYVNLTTLDPGYGVRGKFNPNCFNKGSYRYLFANIPANEDAGESWIYRPGDFEDDDDEVIRNTYFRDFVGGEIPDGTGYVDLEDKVFSFRDDDLDSQKARRNQSWSPVQSFFNFIDVNGGDDGTGVKCNDRMAESLIGCTAGLLSTRYETYTVIAVGQSVKWLMSDAAMPSANRDAFLKQLVNPVQLKDGDWYSILSTQVRQVTLVRDCWFGTFKVVKTQLLYP